MSGWFQLWQRWFAQVRFLDLLLETRLQDRLQQRLSRAISLILPRKRTRRRWSLLRTTTSRHGRRLCRSTTAAPVVKPGGYLQVGFDKLSGFPLRLHWVLVDPVRIKGVQKMLGDVPPDIKALDQSKIAVRGFMLPIKLEDGQVTEFFLLRTQARCCYGLPIQMNELLTVHMAGHGVKSIMDQPGTIYGRLHISENHDDSGALTSIYSLDGDKMDEPSSL